MANPNSPPGFAAEISPLEDLTPVQLNQAILHRLTTIDNQLTAVNNRLTAIENLLTASRGSTNDSIRLRNSYLRGLNSRASLIPLKSVRTGTLIPGCPTTLVQISRLSGDAARFVLTELQVPVPQGVLARRQAVERAFVLPGRLTSPDRGSLAWDW